MNIAMKFCDLLHNLSTSTTEKQDVKNSIVRSIADSGLKSFINLDISGCCPRLDVFDELWTQLLNVANNNCYRGNNVFGYDGPEKFVSRNNQMSAEFCRIMSKVLLSPGQLREIDLTCNSIGDDGVKYLSVGFSITISDFYSSKTPNILHLRSLNLSNNDVGDFGLISLVQGIESLFNNFLVVNIPVELCFESLVLANNNITNTGIRYLYNALVRMFGKLDSNALAHQHLQKENEIEARARYGKFFSTLDVSSNPIEVAGVVDLISLSSFTNLQFLYCSQCHHSLNSIDELTYQLKNSSKFSLKLIDLSLTDSAVISCFESIAVVPGIFQRFSESLSTCTSSETGKDFELILGRQFEVTLQHYFEEWRVGQMKDLLFAGYVLEIMEAIHSCQNTIGITTDGRLWLNNNIEEVQQMLRKDGVSFPIEPDHVVTKFLKDSLHSPLLSTPSTVAWLSSYNSNNNNNKNHSNSVGLENLSLSPIPLPIISSSRGPFTTDALCHEVEEKDRLEKEKKSMFQLIFAETQAIAESACQFQERFNSLSPPELPTSQSLSSWKPITSTLDLQASNSGINRDNEGEKSTMELNRDVITSPFVLYPSKEALYDGNSPSSAEMSVYLNGMSSLGTIDNVNTPFDLHSRDNGGNHLHNNNNHHHQQQQQQQQLPQQQLEQIQQQHSQLILPMDLNSTTRRVLFGSKSQLTSDKEPMQASFDLSPHPAAPMMSKSSPVHSSELELLRNVIREEINKAEKRILESLKDNVTKLTVEEVIENDKRDSVASSSVANLPQSQQKQNLLSLIHAEIETAEENIYRTLAHSMAISPTERVERVEKDSINQNIIDQNIEVERHSELLQYRHDISDEDEIDMNQDNESLSYSQSSVDDVEDRNKNERTDNSVYVAEVNNDNANIDDRNNNYGTNSTSSSNSICNTMQRSMEDDKDSSSIPSWALVLENKLQLQLRAYMDHQNTLYQDLVKRFQMISSSREHNNTSFDDNHRMESPISKKIEANREFIPINRQNGSKIPQLLGGNVDRDINSAGQSIETMVEMSQDIQALNYRMSCLEESLKSEHESSVKLLSLLASFKDNSAS